MCVVMRIEYNASLMLYSLRVITCVSRVCPKTNCSMPAASGQQTSARGVDFILGLIVFRVTLH